MLQPGRSYSIGNQYRYEFNGKEKDKDITSDDYDFGARIYDGRIGRWLSVDPLAKKFPGFSSFNFALNTPLFVKDEDGRDIIIVTSNGTFTIAKRTLLQTPTGREIWKKYAESKTVDIYIAVSPIPGGDAGGSTIPLTKAEIDKDGKINIDSRQRGIGYFSVFTGVDVSNSKGKTSYLIVYNSDLFTDDKEKQKQFKKDYSIETKDNSLAVAGTEILTYLLAEGIYHEPKAHIEDRSGSGDADHTHYGTIYPAFIPYYPPAAGTPADKIKKELEKVREGGGASDDPRKNRKESKISA